MKKNFIKSACAIACVAVASVSGVKAYNASNHSEASMLLAENVEALSQGEVNVDRLCRESPGDKCYLGGGLRALNAKRVA